MRLATDHAFECGECGWRINGPLPQGSGPFCIECGEELEDEGLWYRDLLRGIRTWARTHTIRWDRG